MNRFANTDNLVLEIAQNLLSTSICMPKSSNLFWKTSLSFLNILEGNHNFGHLIETHSKLNARSLSKSVACWRYDLTCVSESTGFLEIMPLFCSKSFSLKAVSKPLLTLLKVNH